jgi:GNAT superfamily N-acetyltransferase
MSLSPDLTLTPATPGDVPVVFDLIKALAAYEKLSHEVTGTTQQLEQALFGDRTYAEAILARWQGHPVGFALFFHNFSTFLAQPGLYLEDLFVLPDYRGKGIGKALLCHLADLAVERGCGRLEWSVLDWNQPAIDFYQHMGATVLPDWRVCRVAGDGLTHLAKVKPMN